jgi:uncharacterized protein (TIGR00730 family)
MQRTVTVFGASGDGEGSAGYVQARRLGRLLAEAGFALCNGGYSGTMEASARGAREAGGHTIGVTNAVFDPREANPYIVEERKAPDFFERLRRLLTLGDAYICLPGSVGTLTEFSLAWTLMQTEALPRRPFVCVGNAWQRVLDGYRAHLAVRPKDFDLITLVDTVEEAVAAVVRALGA